MNMRIITLIGITFYSFLISPALCGETLKMLFKDVPSYFLSQDIRKQAKKTEAVIQSRYVEVKFDDLAGKSHTKGADIIILNLFDNVSFPSIKDRLEYRREHSYTWFGHVKGKDNSNVILTVEGNALAGSITFENKTYEIQELGNGIHAIYEIDPSVFPEDGPSIVPSEKNPHAPADNPPLSNTDDGSIIDVLVVYTQNAAIASPNIELNIQLAIDQTNQSYANSNINQRVRLVHTEQVVYSESTDFGTTVERLKNQSDGYIDEVHSLRNNYGADLSMLIVENMSDDFCGMGYLMTDSLRSNSFEQYAFSVVRLDCLTSYSPAHEMGHNMGAHHDRYSCEDDEGAYDYSHGYVYPPNRWRTIMAYNNECEGSGFYCNKIPYWSNPNINYGGVPTGISENEIDSAENAKSLNNTAYIVANFRKSTSAITTISSSTTTTASDYCTPGCPEYLLGDGQCNSACNIPACNYDNGDCNISTSTISITTTTPAVTTINVPNTYYISGSVRGDVRANISIKLTGTISRNINTNQDGHFTFSDLVGGYYIITPDNDDFAFHPADCVVQNLSRNLTEVNFVASKIETTPCVAEAIYGEESEEVEYLKLVRDNLLSRTLEGRELIRLYYQWSPIIVKFMEHDEEFTNDVKDIIDEVLFVIE